MKKLLLLLLVVALASLLPGQVILEGDQAIVTGNVTAGGKFITTANVASGNALAAAGMESGASTTWGAWLKGYGSTNDVSLFNRSGALALSVPANTTDVQVIGGFSALGTGLHAFSGPINITGSTTADSLAGVGAIIGTGKRIYIGFDTGNDRGFVQAVEAGLSGKELRLQPLGSATVVGGSLAVASNLTVVGTSPSSVAGPLYLPDGSTSTPALTFSADTNTGLARAGTDQLEVTTGGVRSALFSSAGSRILGTTSNDNAPTGWPGEYISSTLAFASRITLTTGTAANITSISLTAGDWDVDGVVSIGGTGATMSYIAGGSSTTSAGLIEHQFTQIHLNTVSASVTSKTPIPMHRYSVSSTTTVYLVIECGFSAGTIEAYGRIRARRAR
ncbi:MAG: hypothetical protein HZC55_04040 [Verrucomicrobia bacterium]|nr:hypothetical protein [Verrucomicrobiota bacterium]